MSIRWTRSQKRFGYRRFFPKPTTPEIRGVLYDAHKQLVPNLKKLTISFSQSGAGQTGTRHFKYYNVQPLQFWNTGLEVETKKEIKADVQSQPAPPKILVQLNDGSEVQVDSLGLTNQQILEKIIALDPEGQIVTNGPGYVGVSGKPTKKREKSLKKASRE